jgi:Protein of unknown function (DUF3987)
MASVNELTAATIQQFFQSIGKTEQVRIRLLLPKDLDGQTAYDLGEKAKQGKFNTLGYLKDGKPFKSVQQGVLDLSDLSYQAFKRDGTPIGQKVINGIAELQNLNALGFGVYFLVNAGTGFNCADMTEGLCLFHESDKVSIEEQQLEIDRITQEFGEPTAVVETGKSLHTYYRLTEPLDRDSWPNYQRRWLQYSNCDDPSLSNINRLMRVPGFNHIRWNKEQGKFVLKLCQTRQINPEASYSLEQFDRVLPEIDSTQWAVSVEPSGGDGLDMRSISEYLEGYNPNGRQGWATAKCPVHGGESLDGLHINLETGAFLAHCGCDCKDVFREAKILALAAGYAPEVAATETAQNTTPLMDAVTAAVTNLSGAVLTAELAAIAEQFKRPIGTVEKMALQIQEEKDNADDDGSELHKLLGSSEFNPVDAIASPVREKLLAEAERWSLPTGGYVMALLTVALSLTKVSTRFHVRETNAKPVLWGGLVGTSNSGKSESLGAITAPLKELQTDYDREYSQKMEDFLTALAEHDAAKKNNNALPELPVEPTCFEAYLDDFTFESLAETLRTQPDDCLLLRLDELKALFGFDRYNAGSNNRARFLSLYDGGEIKVNRKGAKRIRVSDTAVSVIGTTQHSTLSELLKGDSNIEDGLWARFYWVNLPTTPTYSHDPEPNNFLANSLKKAYVNIKAFSTQYFTASAEAKALWTDWYDSMVDKSIGQGSEFLGSVYGKSKDRAARIALALHLVNAAITNQQPAPEVSAETMANAITINRYLLAETEKCLALVGATTNPEQERILKFANKFQGQDWVNSTKTKSWYVARKKPSFQKCRDFMKSVVNLGLAEENEYKHTDPKYQIRINSSPDRSPVVRKTQETALLNGLSADYLISPVVVRRSPKQTTDFEDLTSDDEIRTTHDEKRTTPDYSQTTRAVSPQSHTGKQKTDSSDYRTTFPKELKNDRPLEEEQANYSPTDLLMGEDEDEC